MISKLHYLIGDALEPIKKPALIMHVCNDQSKWGRGFVVSISRKYPQVEKSYHKWFVTDSPHLDDVQFVQVSPNICIANMIAQHGVHWVGRTPPIRYDALEACLGKVYTKAKQDNLIVACPRIGVCLAGGKWDVVESLLKKTMTVDTFVYTLEKEKDKWPSNYELNEA